MLNQIMFIVENLLFFLSAAKILIDENFVFPPSLGIQQTDNRYFLSDQRPMRNWRRRHGLRFSLTANSMLHPHNFLNLLRDK